MKTATLADMTQEEFDAAAQTVVAGVKAYNPKLDTRKGTVLRDLLVNPEAAIEGVAAKQIAFARASTSLRRLQEAEEAGESIDAEDVSAILSNFNVTPPGGTRAEGLVKIVVSDPSVAYSVAEGQVFHTIDEIRFASTEQVTAASSRLNNPGVDVTTPLYEGAAGYFFLVHVRAEEPGSAGNIEQGTSLESESGMYSFVLAEAYKPFDGGSDVPDMEKTIAAIPAGLSIRGFVNKTAVEGMFRAKFDNGNYPIVAVSAAGYGSGVQRRDKHNVFGVGVGGRIDVYVRNFGDMFTITKMIEGSKDADGEYTLSLSASDFPGACWVKSVSDPLVPEDEEGVVGSMIFSATRTSDGASETWHDFDLSNGPEEVFNTVWQGFSVKLSDVVPDVDPEGSSPGWSDRRDFKVTVYCLPQARELQEYVDSDDVRSISADVVVRCPILCNVSVNATVRYDVDKPMDASVAMEKIRSYINGLGFVGRLTRSEIVHILKDEGAVSVDMSADDMLYGVYHDAYGEEKTVQGDALDIWTVQDDRAMVSPATVVFAAEARNIQLKLLPNE